MAENILLCLVSQKYGRVRCKRWLSLSFDVVGCGLLWEVIRWRFCVVLWSTARADQPSTRMPIPLAVSLPEYKQTKARTWCGWHRKKDETGCCVHVGVWCIAHCGVQRRRGGAGVGHPMLRMNEIAKKPKPGSVAWVGRKQRAASCFKANYFQSTVSQCQNYLSTWTWNCFLGNLVYFCRIVGLIPNSRDTNMRWNSC